MVELAVRGQRRVRPWDATSRSSTSREQARALLGQLAPQLAAMPVAGAASRSRPATMRRPLRSAARRWWSSALAGVVPDPAARSLAASWPQRPGAEEHLDRRRRRLGVRHRLRRPRSRAGVGAQRERARARHEVYSNTGGQASKATPRGAAAKFAAGGSTFNGQPPYQHPFITADF